MHSKILINEFFPDPTGADKGWEWIEIVNISNENIDISNWEIQVGGSRYNRAFKFPEESYISNGEYILICEEFVQGCNFYTSTIAMQNGIGKTDGVRILNSSGEVINTVLYSRPNRNELKNDFGDIEIDENIVEKDGEGFSFSRKDFSNTGFSIQDFFTTKQPTPGKENIFFSKIIISEVGYDFVEFYSTKVPSDVNNWYVKESEVSKEKVFLENNFKNNFFFLKTNKSLKNIFLYSSEGILIDSFSKNFLSKHFTYCRLNSLIDEEYSFCEKTEGEKNEEKIWQTNSLLEIIQMGSNASHIIEVCPIYKHKNYFVISDKTAALGVECENCEKDECFFAEFTPAKKIEIIQESKKQNIEIEVVNKDNYISLFNKIVVLKGEVSKTIEDSSYLTTDIGLVIVEGEKYSSENEYTLKGVLLKDENMVINLVHPVVLKQEEKEKNSQLEQTGDPVIFILFFFLIPFLLSKIFVKLITINLIGDFSWQKRK